MKDPDNVLIIIVRIDFYRTHCRVRRGGSRGFVLRDETVDEEFLKESLEAEQKWLGRFRQSQGPMFQRKDTSASSKYSFSTEYNSGEYSIKIAYARCLFSARINETESLNFRERRFLF